MLGLTEEGTIDMNEIQDIKQAEEEEARGKPVETIAYRGCTIEVHRDDAPEDPRHMSDFLGTMVCFHRRYSLGDNHGMSLEDAKRLYTSKDVISLPLYLYDHGGITMSTEPFSCPWDSGMVGYVYVTKKKVREEYGWKKLTPERVRKVNEILQAEVKEYDAYLRGAVYGYMIVGPGGLLLEEGSCWGYYGDDHKDSGLQEAAQAVIDWEVSIVEEAQEISKMTPEEAALSVNREWLTPQNKALFLKHVRELKGVTDVQDGGRTGDSSEEAAEACRGGTCEG